MPVRPKALRHAMQPALGPRRHYSGPHRRIQQHPKDHRLAQGGILPQSRSQAPGRVMVDSAAQDGPMMSNGFGNTVWIVSILLPKKRSLAMP